MIELEHFRYLAPSHGKLRSNANLSQPCRQTPPRRSSLTNQGSKADQIVPPLLPAPPVTGQILLASLSRCHPSHA